MFALNLLKLLTNDLMLYTLSVSRASQRTFVMVMVTTKMFSFDDGAGDNLDVCFYSG